MTETMKWKQGDSAMVNDLQGLLPWIREDRRNAAKLWCAFANVVWQKDDMEFGVSFRSAGALVAELYSNTTDYLDFYCSGNDGIVDPKIFEYLTARGWKPFNYGDNLSLIEITEGSEPHLYVDMFGALPELAPMTEVIPPHVKVMPMKEFLASVSCGGIIDYDGYGYYSDGKMRSSKIVDLGDIDVRYTHVVWINR